MAKKITNVFFIEGGDETCYVYSDLSKDQIGSLDGVRTTFRTSDGCIFIRIDRRYDTQSVLDDIRALADKHAETSEKLAEPLEPRDELEAGEPQSGHPLSTRSLTAVLKEMRKSLEKEILDEYLKDGPPYDSNTDICVYQQCPWTHAIVTYQKPDSGHGYSKCNWPDTWDAEFGALLAVKRAARRLARKMYPG